MLIKIDTTSQQPIYEQIVQQIQFVIASGAVRENELIPSVRELSKSLAINPNTIGKSFKVLQDEGIVILRRGMGLVVAEGAKERCEKQRIEIFEKKIAQALTEAAQSGLPRIEIERIIRERTEDRRQRTGI